LVLPVSKAPQPGVLLRFNIVRALSTRHYARRPNSRTESPSGREVGLARRAHRRTSGLPELAAVTFRAYRSSLRRKLAPPLSHRTNRSATAVALPLRHSMLPPVHGKHARKRRTAGPMHREGNCSHLALSPRRRASALVQIDRRSKGSKSLKTGLALIRLSWLKLSLNDLWT
jgi:hypothetical protein